MTRKTTGSRLARSDFRAVQADYDLGRRLFEMFPERFPYGEAKRIGDRFGRPDLSRDKAEKLRDLAQAYPPKAFQRLLATCRKGGYAPGITILARLATLDSKDREATEKKMVAGKWTNSQLAAELRRRVGRRGAGGRKRRIPDDPKTLLATLHRECESWVRLGELLGESNLDAGLLRRVQESCAAIRRLRREVEAKLESERSPQTGRRTQNGSRVQSD